MGNDGGEGLAMKKLPTLKVNGIPVYVEPPSDVEKALAEAEAMQEDALRYRLLRSDDKLRARLTLDGQCSVEQFDYYMDALLKDKAGQ